MAVGIGTALRRLLLSAAVLTGFLLCVVIPVGGSFLITSARLREPPPRAPESLPVENVEFSTDDGIHLSGWWSIRAPARGTVIFLHGLNNSRAEMADRASVMYARGYSTLLFDLRNHGLSAQTPTTLGVRERRDVCAAARFVRSRDPDADVVLWGVSLGASTALLGADCAGAVAVISDSSFLSFEETVRHHFRAIFHLPAFPIADMLILVTRLRMDFSLSEGDVEAAVRRMPTLPILFVAGSEDWRMPPELARRLYRTSLSTDSDLLIVQGATHGHAWLEDPDRYLATVLRFLDTVLSSR